MNKYSLQFIDQSIEKHYRTSTINNTQYPTFKLSAALGLLFYLILLVFQLLVINIDISKLLLRVISILSIIITFLIVKYNKRLVNLGLLILNCTFTALECEKDSAYDNYNMYYYGGNTMIIHTLMMFPQNFEYSLATNIIIFIARSVIASLYVQVIYLQLVLGIGTMIGFSCLLYLYEKFSRKSYLLSLKDDSWETMLPLILTKPFLMFTFDIANFSYHLKMINKQNFQFNENNTISQFLNNSQYNGQTLQEYIYNSIIKNQQYQDKPKVESLKIIYEKKKIDILLSYCSFGQPNFMIVIQSEDQKLQFKSQHHSYLLYFKTYIQTTCRIMQKAIEQNSFASVFKLMISNRQNLLFYDKKNSIQQNINISFILQRLSSSLQHFNYKISYQLDPNIEVISIKSYILMFFYEIFKIINYENEYFLKAFIKDDQLRITFIGLFRIPNTKLFLFCQDCLIESTIQMNESIQFIFYKQPNLSFSKCNFANYLSPYE